MPKLISMKLSKEQATSEVAIGASEGPRFPFGLSINLDDDSLKKLGFDKLPGVGAEMTVSGVGTVTRASENRSQSGVSRDVSIQLEKLKVESSSDATAVGAVTKAVKDA